MSFIFMVEFVDYSVKAMTSSRQQSHGEVEEGKSSQWKPKGGGAARLPMAR